MKVANVCGSSGVSGGRVARPRRDIENEEVQMYLSKLKELVPFMPKNRKLTKLEVIQYVIDYICDLQEALETTPEVQMYLSKLKELVPFMPKNRKLTKLEVIQYVIDYICDLQEALETTPVVQISTRSPNRQPLGVLAPNTIVPPTSCSTQEAATAPVHLLEKVPTPSDTRPVSV
ncbi:unnamed protein product [Nezara viridula]|uniref:BHLH domain-containing protein n=1 Tax=Nezara viridula TaxID=85310 RepID=A0A9P0HBE7_NEZVI|nr:unnamed protein product [Nezara viridula]